MATAPGYKFWIPIPRGTLRQAIDSPLEFLLRARQRHGDVVRLQVGPIVIHFVFHPDHVTRVLREHQKNYLRGWQYNLLRRLFAENLVSAEGDFWRRQRRLAQPAFHQHMLAAYTDVMVDSIATFLDECEAEVDRCGMMVVAPAVSRLALEIAGRTLFGEDVHEAADTIGFNFATISNYLEFRFSHPLKSLPASWPTRHNRAFQRAKQRLTDVVFSLIRQHRQEAAARQDLLSMLIHARDEDTGEQMTDHELCIEALTFLIAGHETTAKCLTWTLYLLASNAQVRGRLHAEAQAVLGNNPPTFADSNRLVATRMALEESLRLYPPAWALARQAVEDDQIDGFRISARSTVILCPYITHRHPDFWPQPDAFDIDRFAPEQVERRPKGAYFPFIYGPHQCIGMEFALLEMSLIIAMLLQRFDFHLQSNQPIHPVAALTLNPSGPIHITLEHRH